MHRHSSEPAILGSFAKATNHYVLTHMNDMQTSRINNEQTRSCYTANSCTKVAGLCPSITAITKDMKTDE